MSQILGGSGRISMVPRILVLFVAVAFSGLTSGYLPELKYGLSPLDAVSAMLALVCLLDDGRAWRRLLAVAPILIWILIYFGWGSAVSRDLTGIEDEVINRVITSVLVLLTTSAALLDREHVTDLARALQIVVLVNCAVCILQVSDPAFVELTNRRGVLLTPSDIANINFRAVGLWANQNDAARFFLAGLLMSFFCPGPFAIVGRVAAIVGIYLTASRFGAWVLAINAVVGFATILRRTSPRPLVGAPQLVTAAVAVIVLAVTVGVYGDIAQGRRELDYGDITRLDRISDFADSRAASGISHGDLTLGWLARAIDGPWRGEGVFAYQEANTVLASGAHDIYIAVWGEVGPLLLVVFIGVLTVGVSRLWRLPLDRTAYWILLLMWMDWLLAGFASHTQFNTRVTFVMWGLLFCLPSACAASTTPTDGRVPMRALV